ncbi:hypothetical protein D3C76_1190190 [compost metagenome]
MPIRVAELTVDWIASVPESYDQLFISATLAGNCRVVLWLIRCHVLKTSAKVTTAFFNEVIDASSDAMRMDVSISAPAIAPGVPS